MKYAFIASLLSAATTLVSAHGYVEKAIIDGVSYSPYLPYYDPYVSPKRDLIWRPIVGNGPVENLASIDVQCGGYTAGGVVGSKPAPLHAPVAAGGEISLTWTQWPDSHKGPLITYMAKCPGDCSTWEPGTDAVWFKIKEEGKSSSGVWVSEQYETVPVPAYKFNIPSNLAPGNYIVRHEILALHGAWAYPGIQDYPSCFQVKVTGSGTAFPSSDYLVSFPGAYTESTPGIVFDMYNPSLPYPIPGPKVWSGQGGSNATTSPKPTTSAVVVPTTTSRAVVTTTTSRAVVTTSTTVPPAATSTTAAPAPTGATVPKWGQCGGIGYTGPTTCVAGSTCTKSNDYYFQCL